MLKLFNAVLLRLTPLNIFVIVVAALVGYYNIFKFNEKKRVIALGGYAARAKSRWPLGKLQDDHVLPDEGASSFLGVSPRFPPEEQYS